MARKREAAGETAPSEGRGRAARAVDLGRAIRRSRGARGFHARASPRRAMACAPRPTTTASPAAAGRASTTWTWRGDRTRSSPSSRSARNDQIMLVTDGGMVIRCPVHDIRIARRRTQGVVMFKVGEGERVVSVARAARARTARTAPPKTRGRPTRCGAARGTHEQPRIGDLSRHLRPDHQRPYRHHPARRQAGRPPGDRRRPNDGKGPLFTTDERVEIVREEIAHLADADDAQARRGARLRHSADAFRRWRSAPR